MIKGREKVGIPAGSVIVHVSVWAISKSMEGKDVFLRRRENKGKVGQDPSASGRKFQMDGAANENEHWPFADRMSETMSMSLSRDLRFLVGI